ncbi:hypothetical protein DF3PB_10122 [uncultured Defluviicoccus sp.]|uniref:Uncharacterized protein n=1 Tax=metagenome TaxID=256318 RepID=A0A380T873_9ZZZZ|nr:hypothetical protein DF3PB_10122 [uncultured Defluviicoccus sp.]
MWKVVWPSGSAFSTTHSTVIRFALGETEKDIFHREVVHIDPPTVKLRQLQSRGQTSSSRWSVRGVACPSHDLLY